MPTLAEHRLKIRYTGGLAARGLLPGYDGATSVDGVVRAVHIATHAYMTGEVVSRATALRGASIQLKPVRQGSFLLELVVLVETYPAMSGITAAVGAPMFYDFIKTVFRRATGDQDAEPETNSLKRLYNRKQPPPLKKPPADMDELAEVLEGSLQATHRPIGDNDESSVKNIEVSTPRKPLFVLDAETKDWVNTRDEATGLEVVTGNVTRYNSLSRNARTFVEQFERVIPMRPAADFDASSLPFLTWSLHGSNTGAPSKLTMRVRRVTSAGGKVKRLLLVDCQRTPAN